MLQNSSKKLAKDFYNIFFNQAFWAQAKVCSSFSCFVDRGPIPTQDQEFLSVSEKNKQCATIRLGTPPCEFSLSLSLPVAWSNQVNSDDLLQEGQKERNHGKAIEIGLSLQKEISMNNPSSTICVAKHRYKCIVWEKRGKTVDYY